MAKKAPSPNNNYARIAIILCFFVFSTIFILVFRQIQLNRQTVAITKQNQGRTVSSLSPTPNPTPQYITPPGTEDWKVFLNTKQRYTIRYPQDMSFKFESEDSVNFFTGNYKQNPDFEFTVFSTPNAKQIHFPGIMDEDARSKMLSDLFSKSPGVIGVYHQDKNKVLGNTFVYNKLADINSENSPAVFYRISNDYKSQQPPFYANVYLKQKKDVYYTITQGTAISQNALDKYENKFKLVISSFTSY